MKEHREWWRWIAIVAMTMGLLVGLNQGHQVPVAHAVGGRTLDGHYQAALTVRASPESATGIVGDPVGSVQAVGRPVNGHRLPQVDEPVIASVTVKSGPSRPRPPQLMVPSKGLSQERIIIACLILAIVVLLRSKKRA